MGRSGRAKEGVTKTPETLTYFGRLGVVYCESLEFLQVSGTRSICTHFSSFLLLLYKSDWGLGQDLGGSHCGTESEGGSGAPRKACLSSGPCVNIRFDQENRPKSHQDSRPRLDAASGGRIEVPPRFGNYTRKMPSVTRRVLEK